MPNLVSPYASGCTLSHHAIPVMSYATLPQTREGTR